MTDDNRRTHSRDEMPFVAPCRKLKPTAPFRWIRLGLADFRKAPTESLIYGLVSTILIAAVSLLAWRQGGQWILFAMIGGFVFIAPLPCIGLYAISAQLERGAQPQFMRSLRAAFKRHLGNEMVFALALLVVFLVWGRAAMMITALMLPDDPSPSLQDLLPFLSFGTAVGAIFAGITFSASAFSLPMIMHRDVDSVTAIVTSINAVLRNKRATMIWLALIIAGLVIGMVTFFLGLVVIIPLIGYASWHGYLEAIDADAFPRHEVGITATPRSAS